MRWITAQLGTASGVEALPGDVLVVDVRDLVDKPGNEAAAVLAKVEEAAGGLERGRRVVVRCDYGISRSNAVAIGALARAERIPFDEAVRRVVAATGEHGIKLEMVNIVRAALRAEAPPAPAPLPAGRRRVVVTGAGGFIGGRLTAALAARGHAVAAPLRAELDLERDPLGLDRLVKEHGASWILHFATPKVYTDNRAFGPTLTMLRNVLDVCRENGLTLLFPSTWEVYTGYRADRLLVDESLPPNPRGPYGETKLLCETLLGCWARNNLCRVAMLRCGPVIGPGSDRPRFIQTFREKAASGAPVVSHEYLNGSPGLDLLYIDDFVEGVVRILEADRAGVVHLGSGRLATTAEVAERIVAALGSPSELRRHRVQAYHANVLLDPAQAERELGWRATVPWEEGLARILAAAEGGR
jgi:UDP-glucuronate decarboxylase